MDAVRSSHSVDAVLSYFSEIRVCQNLRSRNVQKRSRRGRRRHSRQMRSRNSHLLKVCLFRACVACAVVVWLVGAKLARPPSVLGFLLGGRTPLSSQGVVGCRFPTSFWLPVGFKYIQRIAAETNTRFGARLKLVHACTRHQNVIAPFPALQLCGFMIVLNK